MLLIPLILAAGPIAAETTPPIAGRPETFTGWVGRFSIHAESDAVDVRWGDSFLFSITIQGRGRAGGPPDVKKSPSWLDRFNLVDSDSSIVSRPDGSIVATFHYRLSPKSLTATRIPPIRWSYYDDSTGAFQTLLTNSIPISIRPADIVNAKDVEAARPPLPARLPNGLLIAIGAAGLFTMWLLLRNVRWWREPPPASFLGEDRKPPELRYAPRRPLVLPSRRDLSREELTQLGRDFQCHLAESCGLPPDSATAEEILLAAQCEWSTRDRDQLRQLLNAIDGFRYGQSTADPASADLVNRIAEWMENHPA